MATATIITQWVEDHTDALYQWAAYRLSDDELAKDMVQDTFIAAYEKMQSFDNRSKPRTWLLSILNNKITDHHRRQQRSPITAATHYERYFFDDNDEWRHERRPGEWNGDASLLDDAAFLAVLAHCLDDLPSQWGDAVRLRYLSEKEGKEVCQELNITPSNFWQIIHRAKLSLRQCLEVKWFK